MILALVVGNALAWLILQLAIAAAATHLDPRHFPANASLFRTCPNEVAVYRNILHIRRWKRHLPDGAPWVGGSFRKKRLQRHDPAYLRHFLLETRRGEAAHWLMLSCFPIFFLWNPHWAWIVMAGYAIAANLPCILVQRYNRHVFERLLARHKASAIPPEYPIRPTLPARLL